MTSKGTALPLTELRRRLSPLVRDIDRLEAVAVTVRGEVRAYLVSPARLARVGSPADARPRPIRGTVRLEGDLDAGSRDAASAWLSSAKAGR